jgi:hypothetical protein
MDILPESVKIVGVSQKERFIWRKNESFGIDEELIGGTRHKKVY